MCNPLESKNQAAITKKNARAVDASSPAVLPPSADRFKWLAAKTLLARPRQDRLFYQVPEASVNLGVGKSFQRITEVGAV